jgi:hypothetical protein
MTVDDTEFYSTSYKSESGLSIRPILTVENGVVVDLRVGLNPDNRMAGTPREWMAYSPESLIEHYGPPSAVEFFVGRAAPLPSYAMDLYFDAVNLIVEYYSYDLGPQLEVCPLVDQMDHIRVWMGENPQSPPHPDERVSLESASALTLEAFSELMMGDPGSACLNLKEEAFP